jgi:putative tricarboxylic transport membrane protein
MVERSLRQSLLISGGDLTIFVTRPISGTLIAIFVLLIVGQSAFFIKRKLGGKKTAGT